MRAPYPRKRFERDVRVVIVEDTQADAELMLEVLAWAGFRVQSRWVQEAPELRAALSDFRPDVVLTDSTLPRFSGVRALRMVRAHDPMLPVIMVTGTLAEHRIFRLIRLGLANYVLKGNLVRLPPVVLDALERAAAQRTALRDRNALAASERRFRAVAEASGDGLVIADERHKIVFWNPAAERLFGYSAEQAVGMELAHLVPGMLEPKHRAGIESLGRGGPVITPLTMEVRALRADGQEFPAELTVSGWEEDGRWLRCAQVRDITARKEEARQRNILGQAVERTATAVVITDVDGRIEYVNAAFTRLTGYALNEVVGLTPRILKSGKQPPELYRRLWAEITGGRPFSAEMTNVKKDGTEYVQRTTIFPILGEGGEIDRFMGLGYDVTHERLLERQLRQSQKMEAVGQLAGGIAHDFNNLLTGVLTNAQLLAMTMPEGATEERELVKDVMSAARRGTDLVKRLMSLSRTSAGATSSVDVRSAVDEAVKTVRRTIPENIELTVEHSAEPLPCVMDEGELQQALLNLANNARDAMPDGGRLDLRTHRVDETIVIEVRDNGVGMDAAVAERIFEPFFTTKPPGKGTGLGLPMVYGFVKSLGGNVAVDSRPGAGTTVRLLIPIARPSEGPEDAANASPEALPMASARGTVLLAEDEADIRKVAQKVLRQMGYRVLVAVDGVEAMTILNRERGRVDLVLSDLVMPRGGGAMLFRNTTSWPDQPRFLFMSGYSAGQLGGDSDLLRTVPFLPKPWSVEDLKAAVERVLREAGP